MSIFSEFFDKSICINLDRRTDRWEENCLPQFRNLGLDVERFSAIDGKEINIPQEPYYKAELAGSISHLEVLKRGSELNIDKLLVLEDDVVFTNNIEELFKKSIINIPEDWDILFFGGNHVQGFSQVSEGIIKLNGSYAIHACGVRKKAFDIMIACLENNINQVKNHSDVTYKPSVAADYFLAKLHTLLNVYCFYPHLAWQKDGFSDIQNVYTNYSFLKH